MSHLLEIFGRAITVDTAELIWQWLDTIQLSSTSVDGSQRCQKLYGIIEQARNNPAGVDRAAEKLRLYLFDNPSCAYGRMAAAAILLQENRFQQALVELNSVYMRQPSNTMALYALGYCNEMLGSEPQAVEFYQDCLKFKNYLQLPRQRLAAIYFKNGRLEKTIHEYELLKNEYPDDMPTLTTLGHLYMAAERYEQAADTFNTAILIHPDNFNDENDEVQKVIQAGQIDDALDILNDCLDDEPERADLHSKKGDCLAMQGSTSQAIEHYQQAIKIHPDFLEANIKLGTQYMISGAESEAAKQYNIAMEINDRIVDAYMGLSLAYKLLNNNSDAMLVLSLASSIQANTPLLFAEATTLQFKASARHSQFMDDSENQPNVFDAVIGAYHRQIAQRSENPDLYYRLGVLLMSVSNLPVAIEAFEKALEINPMHGRAKTKLILCTYETKRRQQALDKHTMTDCLGKETLELHYKTALLYNHKIKFASSLLDLHYLMASNLSAADPAVNVSIVLQNLGMLDRAQVLWDNLADTSAQAANTYPD